MAAIGPVFCVRFVHTWITDWQLRSSAFAYVTITIIRHLGMEVECSILLMLIDEIVEYRDNNSGCEITYGYFCVMHICEHIIL